ncbi:hypothetical protein FNL37_1802 [Methylovorus glucosotrophus]|nr:hypothetical protein FNL37_1802 [Methylovorus glucosotrophus]
MSTQLFRVWCKFEPDHVNPLTGRRGQWRVTRTAPFSPNRARLFYTSVRFEGELAVLTTKVYRRGSIIRPHKELNRVLALRGSA